MYEQTTCLLQEVLESNPAPMIFLQGFSKVCHAIVREGCQARQVCGLEHVLCFHIFEIIIPID